MMKHTSLFLSCLLLAPLAVPAAAEVKLPAIFGDHMVLQRDSSVPFWGTAAPGEAVTVTVGAATASTKADKDGKWMVRLEKLPATATPVEVDISGTNKIALQDVLIGDVWLCSGQSNMALPLAGASTAATEVPQATRPNLRLFLVQPKPALAPQSDCVGHWELCSPETAKGFSAVGYFFGKEIAETEKTPVGLIGSYHGGTVAQAWTSLDALSADPDLKTRFADAFTKFTANLDAIKAAHDQWLAQGGADYEKALTKWHQDSYAAKQKGTPPPPGPPKPPTPEPPPADDPNLPSVLYNGMIAPLVPFAIKGVVWYQGESNSGGVFPYRTIFSAMIADWRKHWGEGDFPFIYVQLPNFGKRSPQPVESVSGWTPLRETQMLALKTVPQTGMAITIDAGDGNNLHPPYKEIVGHRLALVARHLVYGEDLVYSGPIFDSWKIEGAKITITFKNVGTGLKIAAPPVTPPGTTPPPLDQLQGFAVAGSNQPYVWAHAVITGPDTVTVSSDQVPAPTNVRYAWDADPEVNLYNSADLPASPFRTDDAGSSPAPAPR